MQICCHVPVELQAMRGPCAGARAVKGTLSITYCGVEAVLREQKQGGKGSDPWGSDFP